jgi:Fe-S cluster assembly protein SufD
VLENDCTSIVRGKIYVAPEAQKTDGYQSSRSLLLNENSKFFCKPELEIYADDVICSHGSTSSSLDRESLFYLLSRGVHKSKAKEMLVIAFISEALEEIESEDIKAAVSNYIENWISSFFNE